MNEPIRVNISKDHLTIYLLEDETLQAHTNELVRKHGLQLIQNPMKDSEPFIYGNQQDLYWFLFDLAYHYDILLL